MVGIQERIDNAAKRLEKRVKERKRQADKQNKAGQCDIISTACVDRLERENAEIVYITRREFIPECMRRMKDTKVKMVRIELETHERKREIYPIVLFGRSEAIIMGRESSRRLTTMLEDQKEDIDPLERSDQHIQIPTTKANNKESDETDADIIRKKETFKYVNKSRYY